MIRSTSQSLGVAEPGVYRCVRVDDSAAGMTRLSQLGLCEGRDFQIVTSGNPIVVQIEQTTVGISNILADRILVQSQDN